MSSVKDKNQVTLKHLGFSPDALLEIAAGDHHFLNKPNPSLLRSSRAPPSRPGNFPNESNRPRRNRGHRRTTQEESSITTRTDFSFLTPSSTDPDEAPLLVTQETERFDSSDEDFPIRKPQDPNLISRPAPNFHPTWTRGIALEDSMPEISLHSRSSEQILLCQLDELEDEQKGLKHTISILQTENTKLLKELQESEQKRETMCEGFNNKIEENEILEDDNEYLEMRFEKEKAWKEEAWVQAGEMGKVVVMATREKTACKMKIETLQSKGLIMPGERKKLNAEIERLKAQFSRWEMGGVILRERLRGEGEAHQRVWEAEIESILGVVRWTRRPKEDNPQKVEELYAQEPWKALISIQALMEKLKRGQARHFSWAEKEMKRFFKTQEKKKRKDQEQTQNDELETLITETQTALYEALNDSAQLKAYIRAYFARQELLDDFPEEAFEVPDNMLEIARQNLKMEAFNVGDYEEVKEKYRMVKEELRGSKVQYKKLVKQVNKGWRARGALVTEELVKECLNEEVEDSEKEEDKEKIKEDKEGVGRDPFGDEFSEEALQVWGSTGWKVDSTGGTL